MKDIRKKLAGKTTKLAQDRPRQDDHPANVNDCQEGSYYHLDINLIFPDPEQPESCFEPEALEELAKSIKHNRLYQPVVVRKDETGRILLVAGKRRFRAAKMAGLEKIPAIFTQGNPLEVSLIENLQRENLKPIEEAEIFGRMIEQHGYTPAKLAFAIGKAPHAISEAINLNRLPATIKDACRQDDKYPRRLLAEIAEQDTPEAMMSLFDRVKLGDVKSDEGKQIARKKAEIVTPAFTETTMDMDRDVSVTAFLPKDDFERFAQRRKAQLLIELENLIKIIDELIIQ